MAATKRALEIRAAKQAVTDQIYAVADNLRQFPTRRIPARVVNGSAQDAIEFKRLIELAAATPPPAHFGIAKPA